MSGRFLKLLYFGNDLVTRFAPKLLNFGIDLFTQFALEVVAAKETNGKHQHRDRDQ